MNKMNVFGTIFVEDQPISIQTSAKDIDTNWDTFIASMPDGRFEQTSMWARVKSLERWEPTRVLFYEKDTIVGGFQILSRSKRPIGRIGYVSKGPVILPSKEGLLPYMIDSLRKVVASRNIKILILHPPRLNAEALAVLADSGFMPNPIKDLVQNATVMIDLGKDEAALLASMKRQKKQNIKKAYDSGVTIREGSLEDLNAFFLLMQETCKRQGVAPNPPHLQSFVHMWNVFQPTGQIKLFFACYKGEDISGVLAIPFGQTVNLWKFGWSGKYSEYRPNDLLFWEIFKWTRTAGYRRADLVHISVESAKETVREQRRPDSVQKTPSFFKLGWGGDVVMLPESYVYFKNPVVKALFQPGAKLLNSWPWLKRTLLNPS